LLPDGRLRVTDQGADDRAGLGDERRAIGGERDARRKRKRVGDELELAHAAQADYALRREGERFGADDAGVKGADEHDVVGLHTRVHGTPRN
jgi:hypothetical protein